MNNGKFIIIEGIDGSGKTTIAQNLAETLNYKGFKTIFLNKKSTGYESRYLKSFMSNIKKSLWESDPNDPVSEVDEESWLYLHMLWYRMVQENLISKLVQNNDFVIMDGWFYKFWARHLNNVSFDFDFSLRLINRLHKGDRVFFLDINPEISFERKSELKLSELGEHSINPQGSDFEKFVFYQSKVRETYIDFSKKFNFDIIDVNESPINDVVDVIVKKLLA